MVMSYRLDRNTWIVWLLNLVSTPPVQDFSLAELPPNGSSDLVFSESGAISYIPSVLSSHMFDISGTLSVRIAGGTGNYEFAFFKGNDLVPGPIEVSSIQIWTSVSTTAANVSLRAQVRLDTNDSIQIRVRNTFNTTDIFISNVILTVIKIV